MEITKRGNFPPLAVHSNSKSKPNLAPIILSQYRIDNHLLDTYIPVLREAYKNSHRVSTLAETLNLKPPQESVDAVFPYIIEFGKLQLILPMASLSQHGETCLSYCGWIPTDEKDMPSINNWKFAYRIKKYEGRREIKNFMERREKEHSLERMSFYLTPYIPGLAFEPQSWQGEFSFSAFAVKKDEIGWDYKDSAHLDVEFGGSEELHIKNMRSTFLREYREGKRKIKFSHGDFGWTSEKIEYTPGKLRADIEGNIRIQPNTIKRVSEGRQRHTQDSLRYKDLVACEMFPQLDLSKYDLDDDKTLAGLVTAFEEGNFNGLTGFDWVKFR